MNVAVIPARGGSKRIPRKNIRPFGGRPMMAWPIDTLRACGLFDHIILSTDDEEIAAIGRDLGAEVPFMRPAALAGDHTGTLEVVAHAAEWVANRWKHVEFLCCVYPTAPFVTPDDFGRARALLAKGGWDYVFAAGRQAHSPYRSFSRTADGSMEMLFPEHRLTRSQDLPATYHDAGVFYEGRIDAWLETRPVFGSRTSFVELPPWRVQDIDTLEDWTMAEHRFETLQRMRNGQ